MSDECKTLEQREQMTDLERLRDSASHVLAIAMLLLAPVAHLSAHQDPIGDLYPIVKVENDNFAIYFYNNAQESKSNDYDMSGNDPVFRIVYSPSGELLGPRAPCKNIRSESLWTANSMVYNKAIELKGERVLFDADLLKGGKPSYLIEKNGTREHRRLPWPDDVQINYVAGVNVSEKSIGMSATTEDRILKLFHFDRAKFETPATATIGKPTFIYDFPGASNLIFAAGRYWLGWIRYNQEKQKCETVLSDWRPGEKQPHEVVLDAPSDWNTELSLAATENHLCLAYHFSVTGEYPGYSQIITIFREIK